MEFPKWFMPREWGWLPLGFLKTNVHADILGGHSHFMVLIMQMFFGDRVNISRGVLLSAGFVFVAEHGFFLQDEKADKSTFEVKGASGKHCCPKCRNVLKCHPHLMPTIGSYQHTAHARPRHFELHTVASYAEIVEKLRQVHSESTRSHLADVETALGVSYNPLGLLFHPVFGKLCPPVAMFEDPMHVLFASGGCVQFEMNSFVLELVANDVELCEIDAITAQVEWPSSSRNSLPLNFFQSRTVHKANSHMKAFASETLTAMAVLMCFVDTVLVRRPAVTAAMGRHIVCFKLMFLIVELLFSDEALQTQMLKYIARDQIAKHFRNVQIQACACKHMWHVHRHC
jgi:hypothetical protein